jgi:hypothetical protein
MFDVPSDLTLTRQGVNGALRDWSRKIGRPSVDLPWPELAPDLLSPPQCSSLSWVYIARRPCDGVLKVGFSGDPLRRVKHLSRGGGGFNAIGFLPFCTLAHEAELINVLAPFALDGGREWFRDCRETRLFAWQITAALAEPIIDEPLKVFGYELKDAFRALGEFIAGGYVEPSWLDPEDHAAIEMAEQDRWEAEIDEAC